MSNAKIVRAKEASDQALEQWSKAYRHLQQDIQLNGAGILADPLRVRSAIRQAKDALDVALSTLEASSGDWPSDEDYPR
jgi:hypothetical protein